LFSSAASAAGFSSTCSGATASGYASTYYSSAGVSSY